MIGCLLFVLRTVSFPVMLRHSELKRHVTTLSQVPVASECELLPFSSRSSLVASLALRRQPARTHCMLSRTTEHDRRLELRAFVAALLMRRGPKRRHKSVMLVHSTKTRPRVSCVACTTASGWHRGPLYGARLTSATGLRWPSSHTVSSFRQQM